MTLAQRINAFVELGKSLNKLDEDTLQHWIDEAGNENRWFTPDTVKMALDGVTKMLSQNEIEQWISSYQFGATSHKIGIVMAGNIPLVGFHDLLSVLISGNQAFIKLSSQDSKLLPKVTDIMISIEPYFKESIHYVSQLKGMDAVIATGSDNSARYFRQYFGNRPNIIRKNRTSCAVLTGKESNEELLQLGRDIFSYYGLGCRNVSKLFVPEGYDFKHLLEILEAYAEIGNHSKWRNNYDYNKSIYLVNREPHLDNGFLLLKESLEMVSPLSVLYYQQYSDLHTLVELLSIQEEKIQCVVGDSLENIEMIPFGKAQYPEVWDYADGVDTLQFLSEL
ncbi:MAG: acyl-CoA reductase [Cyclobacteriaceae bacterium]|nr:acyl-CoA reductase [Cyclobacteriaceae bacterium]